MQGGVFAGDYFYAEARSHLRHLRLGRTAKRIGVAVEINGVCSALANELFQYVGSTALA